MRRGPLPEDHVLGIGRASLTLAGATQRRPVACALDVGVGCGIQTLHLLAHAGFKALLFLMVGWLAVLVGGLVAVALGLLLLALRAAGTTAGWGFQLQDPRIVFVLLLLVVAIALNLAGLFELPAIGAGGYFNTRALSVAA